MKYLMKPFALLLIAAFVLTGCTPSEVKFVSSLQKLQEVKHYEQTSHVSFELDYSGGDEYFQANMEKAKYIFKDMALDFNIKSDGSAKSGKSKTAMSAEATLEPVKVYGEMWADIDLASGKYELIVKIPALFKAFLPEEYAKDYLYIDYSKLLSTISDGYDYDSLGGVTNLAAIFEQSQRVNEFIEMLMSSKGLSGNYVLSSSLENGREKLTLKMSDKQLKRFIIAFLNEIKTNEELLDAFLEFFESYVSIIDPVGSYLDDSYSAEEMKGEIINGIDEAIPEIEAFFAQNSLLGSNGLLYEITLDSGGYVSNEKLAINFMLSNEINSFLPYYWFDEDSGTIDFTVTLKSEYTNINGSGKVELPKLTKANSANLVAIVKEEAERQKEERTYYFPHSMYSYSNIGDVGEAPVEFPIVGEYNGSKINSKISVARIGGNRGMFYMPLRQAAELFGGEIVWNANSKTAVWDMGDIALGMVQNGYLDDETLQSLSKEYDKDVYFIERSVIIDGAMFIPLDEMEYNTNIDFGFDNSAGTFLIR